MFEQYLQEIVNGNSRLGSYFLGETLCLDSIGGYEYICINMDGKVSARLNDKDVKWALTNKEYKLLAEIYIIHKTPSHHYYKKARKLKEMLL